MSDTFQLSYVPKALPCRDEEIKEINNFIMQCLDKENDVRSSLYVSGSPGTGKTACIKHVISTLPSRIKPVFINCSPLSNQLKSFYNHLGHSIGIIKGNNSNTDITDKLHTYFKSSRSKVIVVLDELDTIIGVDFKILLKLFQWSSSSASSSLILIGIANRVDLTDTFLPQLKSLGCDPRQCVFKPYDSNQIVQILQSRIENKEDMFDTRALEFCAKRVTTTGDFRKALELCRSAYLLASKEKVSIIHMNKASKAMFESRPIISMKMLPQQGKYMLCSVVALQKDLGLGSLFTVQDLLSTYRKLCDKMNIPPVPTCEHVILLSQLLDQGFISYENNSKSILGKRKSKSIPPSSTLSNRIKSGLTIEDILYAFEDQPHFYNILNRIQSGDLTSTCHSKVKRIDLHAPRVTDESLFHDPSELRKIESEKGDGSLGDTL